MSSSGYHAAEPGGTRCRPGYSSFEALTTTIVHTGRLLQWTSSRNSTTARMTSAARPAVWIRRVGDVGQGEEGPDRAAG